MLNAYINPQTGKVENQQGSGGAAYVTTSGPPAPQIIPTVAGVSQAEKTLNADAAGTAVTQIIEVRVTVNSGDSIVAANRLMNGYPDVATVYPGESIRITSESVITNVTLIGIADAVGTVDGVAQLGSTTLSDFTGQQIEYDFTTNDGVNTVEISLSDLFASGRQVQQKIAGYAA